MKKKVLHVAETVKGGVATVIRQLVQQNDEFDFYCVLPDSQYREIGAFPDEKMKVFSRTGRNIPSFISLAIKYIQLVRKEKPDVIHVHSTFAGVVCRLLTPLVRMTCKPKIIYCPHAFSFLMDTSEKKKKVYAKIEKVLQKNTDVIICTSEYEKRTALMAGMEPGNLTVVYNGVEPPVALPDETNPYHQDKINILFVGRFDYQKGFDLVQQIADKLDDRFLITIVGGNVHAKEQPAPHVRMDFKGWLTPSAMAPYFTYADVLLMPSRWESFGLVAVEAESYGLPVVASRCSSLPEVVNEGVTGYLFTTNAADEAAEILSTRDKRDWGAMKADCVDFYNANFTSEKMVSNTYRLYR
ncbi:glycosyltransferase family 4 protein [Serratia marcescens]|uniref:glycosyltransferase family 4 protein n=1 Tax=Serratia marcescens TaxID=615 RepID=UPI0018D9899F|nr:glycosyltransferase family 4 protein [Serratia marcescens]MBH3010817.1 glycosyltransferase family 4 protein [Serratia marcescens]MBN5247679.1 glycosyltransferase family 4 protein [Serratia marcescens]MBN5257718.1 glycosyltransferase family 4 protein [Serratia marcescens]MBN5352938.1 glycosyltransferase family 4 protein [Serratia marcescens]MEE4610093.1 glycosyltransferase family 4 protein [Serratia marcescens]